MRTVSFDLSSDSIYVAKQFGGYQGEHNATLLSIKLPERMLTEEIAQYRFDFETSTGENILGEAIDASSVSDGVIQTTLFQSVMFAPILSVCVCAYKYDPEDATKPILIEKSSAVDLIIKNPVAGSEDGEAVDPLGPGSGVTVDTALDPTSLNPIANKPVAEKFQTVDSALSDADSAIQEMQGEIARVPITSGKGDSSGRNDLSSAGSLGFRLKTSAISQTGEAFTWTVSLCDDTGAASDVSALSVDDLFSCKAAYSWNFCGTITAISGSTLTVLLKGAPPSNTTSSWAPADHLWDSEDPGYLWCPTKPDAGVVPLGTGAFAVGGTNHSNEEGSFSAGSGNIADGRYSSAFGRENKAGYCAHAEGYLNEATELYSHVEGTRNVASGNASHAEGRETVASGPRSHAEGTLSEARGDSAHAEGSSLASGALAHSEGSDTTASGNYSHAEGILTQATRGASHAEGRETVASGVDAHAEGRDTTASGSHSHAEGLNSTASGGASHAEGDSIASGDYSHAEGGPGLTSGQTVTTEAAGVFSHAEGRGNYASGEAAHVEGRSNSVYGIASHAEGRENTIGSSTALKNNAHVEGYQNTITGQGTAAHAEGASNTASGNRSHVEGEGNTASGTWQHVQGKYNVAMPDKTNEDNSKTYYLDVVGGGTSGTHRNISVLDSDGNLHLAGNVFVNNTSNDCLEGGISLPRVKITSDNRAPATVFPDPNAGDMVLRIIDDGFANYTMRDLWICLYSPSLGEEGVTQQWGMIAEGSKGGIISGVEAPSGSATPNTCYVQYRIVDPEMEGEDPTLEIVAKWIYLVVALDAGSTLSRWVQL